MTRAYYKEANGCFIVFDVTRGLTSVAVTKWKIDLDNKVKLPNGNRLPCVLLANKVNLTHSEEERIHGCCCCCSSAIWRRKVW